MGQKPNRRTWLARYDGIRYLEVDGFEDLEDARVGIQLADGESPFLDHEGTTTSAIAELEQKLRGMTNDDVIKNAEIEEMLIRCNQELADKIG